MTTFGTRIRPAVDAELQAAKTADNAGQAQLSFRHLERAHVLGQPWACEMCDISIAPTSGVAASGWLPSLSLTMSLAAFFESRPSTSRRVSYFRL
ncbi:DUF3703 domain-containing protein [Acidovorax sp. 100]|jgi:hypothetical protein|uniref:DUF3703 domain-containing protein n=1 Tax=Acidovorax sp. 100 TaxID=2135635 RepID=UPI000EF994AE|nr:DUF3703 domain-containing protein [Acidovorax sp. 100]